MRQNRPKPHTARFTAPRGTRLLLLPLAAVLLAGGLAACKTAPETPPNASPTSGLRADAAIPGEGLAALLAAQYENPTGQDTWELLQALPGDGCTLGVLRYRCSVHAGGFANLIFGVFDNAARSLPDAARTSGVVLPPGAATMLGHSANMDFWSDRKALIQGAGLTIFRRGSWVPNAEHGSDPRWELERSPCP